LIDAPVSNDQSNGRVEADFMIFRQGKCLILEVDGQHHLEGGQATRDYARSNALTGRVADGEVYGARLFRASSSSCGGMFVNFAGSTVNNFLLGVPIAFGLNPTLSLKASLGLTCDS